MQSLNWTAPANIVPSEGKLDVSLVLDPSAESQPAPYALGVRVQPSDIEPHGLAALSFKGVFRRDTVISTVE
jgi:hypothetical protein